MALSFGMEYDRTYTGSELGHRMPEIVVERYFRDRPPVYPLTLSPGAGRGHP